MLLHAALSDLLQAHEQAVTLHAPNNAAERASRSCFILGSRQIWDFEKWRKLPAN